MALPAVALAKAGADASVAVPGRPKDEPFKYCLNTSTLRGHVRGTARVVCATGFGIREAQQAKRDTRGLIARCCALEQRHCLSAVALLC